MKIGEKIVTLRKANGLSQEEFAQKLGVSRQAVSKWELGESLPDIENVVRMAETFGVTTDYLLKDGTDSAETQTAEQKTDRLRSACVFAVGLSAAGLVLITAAYYTWQSMLSMSIGFLVQMAGVVLLEAAYQNGAKSAQRKTMRTKGYAAALPMMVPFSLLLALYRAASFVSVSFYTLGVLFLLAMGAAVFFAVRAYRNADAATKADKG